MIIIRQTVYILVPYTVNTTTELVGNVIGCEGLGQTNQVAVPSETHTHTHTLRASFKCVFDARAGDGHRNRSRRRMQQSYNKHSSMRALATTLRTTQKTAKQSYKHMKRPRREFIFTTAGRRTTAAYEFTSR